MTEQIPEDIRAIADSIASNVIAQAIMAERERLYEAHRIISIYWDAIDLLFDGPDASDIARAQALIAGVQVTASPIAEAFRVSEARRVTKE